MSSPEKVPADSPQDTDNVIKLELGQSRVPESTGVRMVVLSDEMDRFLDEQTELHGVSDDVIVQNALESYKFFLDAVNTGSTIVIVDKFGRTTSVTDNQ